MKKITCPSKIMAFDINKNGNGAIASGGILSDIIIYRIKAFQVESQPIKVTPPGAESGSFIYDLYMVDDSIMKLTLNGQQSIIITDFDRLRKNQYTVLDDAMSHYLSYHLPDYVGYFENEYYLFDCKDRSEGVIAIKKDSIERIMASPAEQWDARERGIGRIIELGDLGRVIPMSNPIRLDDSSGFFYVMLVQKGNLVIRKFDIKDFGLKK
jgi:hypothetical protein